MVLEGLSETDELSKCPNINNKTPKYKLSFENMKKQDSKMEVKEGFFGGMGMGMGMGEGEEGVGPSESEMKDNPFSKAMSWFTGKQFKTLFLAGLIINLIAFIIIVICGGLGLTGIGLAFAVPIGVVTVILTTIANFIMFVVGGFQLFGHMGLI